MSDRVRSLLAAGSAAAVLLLPVGGVRLYRDPGLAAGLSAADPTAAWAGGLGGLVAAWLFAALTLVGLGFTARLPAPARDRRLRRWLSSAATVAVLAGAVAGYRVYQQALAAATRPAVGSSDSPRPESPAQPALPGAAR